MKLDIDSDFDNAVQEILTSTGRIVPEAMSALRVPLETLAALNGPMGRPAQRDSSRPAPAWAPAAR